MAISTLLKTIVIEHERHGPFKFEIYLKNEYYSADIQYRNGDGRWMVHQNGYGFPQVKSIDDAQSACERFIENLGK
ncbi:hypothetical protein FR762_15615 [Enterobacter sp. E76]|nr:hypothetical protein FR762_15615 [Enterobacter sp. E76]